MEISKKNLRNLARIREFLTSLELTSSPNIEDINVRLWNDSESYVVDVYYRKGLKNEEMGNMSDEIWKDLNSFLNLPMYVVSKTK